MELYLLKFSACLSVFWLVYVLLLEKQQMHRFKRFYLLGSFVVSLVIPELTIIEYVEPIVQNFEVTNAFIPIEAEVIPQPIEVTPVLTLETILWTIYMLGAALFAIRFAINLFRLYRQIVKNDKQRNHSFIYVLLKTYRIPHSFFKFIFVNQYQFENNQIPEEVRLHEETHAKQWHSLDILLLELLQIIFWFHPLVYVLKHHVKLNHEFLADEAVLQQGVATKSYQNILLQFSSNTQDSKLVSAINYSSFKKRFTVMKTQTSKTRIWLSTLLLLPILAILFYSFAEREYVEKDQDLLDSIKQELDKANKLNVMYIDGATKAMMKEYNDWIIKFNTTHYIDYSKYQRIVAIYDMMTEEQRASVEKYPVIPDTNLSEVKPKSPTAKQFEDWKNTEKYALWIDGVHVPNSVLNNYVASDIFHFVGSKIHDNAQSEKFPQPFQFSLYSKDGFRKNYQKSAVNNYNSITKKYANSISTYLKGDQKDNSELKILKAQADKIYSLFSKEELKEHNILPPPPVPAENNDWQKVDDILDQQKATEEEISEYNTWAKKIHTESKKLSNDATWYPPIDEKDLVKFSDIYKRMSSKQKNNAVEFPFPNLDLKPSEQQKATKEQIAEYNTWAKKMNSAIKKAEANKSHEYPIIKQKDVEHYLNIYKNLMTDEQRKNAEAWPNIPPPPPPPPTIADKSPKRKTLKEIIKETPKDAESGYEMLDNGETHYYTIIKGKKTYYNKDGYITDDKGNILPPPPPSVPEPPKAKNNTADITPSTEAKKQNVPPVIYVNEMEPNEGYFFLTKEELKKLKLTLSEGNVTNFKLKIPGIKTDVIKGNSISATSIKNLENFEEGMITIFDIKDEKKNQLPPIIIQLKK